MRISTAVVLGLLASVSMGCQSTGSVLDTKTKQGAVLGTLAGAVAGAAIGGKDHRAGGALIGAAAGAITGGLAGKYLDQQAADLDAIPGADVEKRDDSILVNFQGGLLFDTGSSNLEAGGYDRLRSMAQTLIAYPESRVIVKGHTDSTGAEDFNQKLSEERADRVRNFLVAEGVTPDRITSVGFGESLPLSTNATSEGRAQNRRVEVEIRPNEEVLRSTQ